MADIREKLQQTGSNEVFGLEEALAKINIELLNPTDNKLLTVSDITAKEVFHLSYLLTMAEKLNSKIIKKWVENFLLLRISRYRLGRREFVFISGGMRDMSQRKGGKTGISDLFAGFK